MNKNKNFQHKQELAPSMLKLDAEKESKKFDELDSLSPFSEQFYRPKQELYFCGHSLGLMPKAVEDILEEEISAWKKLGVAGHFKKNRPWYAYHETVTESLSKLVGALPTEVVAMNSLTVNLHLLFVSFFRPSGKRKKILMERDAFPSDRYAVSSQISFHGFDPREDIIYVMPSEGRHYITLKDIHDTILANKDELALIFLSGVHYLTGQYFPLEAISYLAKDLNIPFGLDLAHAIGNVPMELHNWGVDFACWCSYKYLNAGPGAIGGIYIHENHLKSSNIPRFNGWWGHNKKTRFDMGSPFEGIQTAEGWQLSNPSIFSLAPLKASLDLFDKASITQLREKSKQMIDFLEMLFLDLSKRHQSPPFEITTPPSNEERGAMLTLKFYNKDKAKNLHHFLTSKSVEIDFRSPDTLRLSAVPLYTSYEQIFRLYKLIENYFD